MGTSVEPSLPVSGHPAFGPRNGLGERVVLRRSERWPFGEFLGGVVPEPFLAGLETPDHAVLRALGVRGGVLTGRVVAAADVTALRTPAEMQPPPVRPQAFDAAG